MALGRITYSNRLFETAVAICFSEQSMSNPNIKVPAVFRILEETLSAVPTDRLLQYIKVDSMG